MRKKKHKLAIIGGGAAGLMAAISASENLEEGEVIILEKNRQLGRKIYATGNGRCNFSNLNCSGDDYSKRGAGLVKSIFEIFGPEDTVEFLEKIGLYARADEEGRLYPYSLQASSVVEILEETIKRNKVAVSLENEVKSIRKNNGLFNIKTSKGTLVSEKLIIATGGKAGLRLGSTGDGYGFARSLGHELITPKPALVHVIVEEKIEKGLKGVRARGEVTLKNGEKNIAKEQGEVQISEGLLSGICVFELTRHMSNSVDGLVILLDLFPHLNEEEVYQRLIDRKKNLGNSRGEMLLKTLVHEKLINFYLKEANINRDEKNHSIGGRQIKKLAGLLKSKKFRVKGTKGWVEAQVSSGGINTGEVNPNTLESKLCPGLFLAGELLDVDGPCGGWNLQWAFSSGYVAGKLAKNPQAKGQQA